MQVTNTQRGPRGLNTVSGPILLDPGQTVDNVELSGPEEKIARDSGWFDFGKAAAKKAAPEPVDLKAAHRGGGSYSIMDGDKEVKQGLNKADAEAFNAMSDEDKAAYVKA